MKEICMSFCIREIYPQYFYKRNMKKKMYELLYWRNISTIYIFKTNYKWQVVISEKNKNKNFSGKFKLEPIIIYYLWFFCKNVMCVILLFIFTSIEYRQFSTSPLLYSR